MADASVLTSIIFNTSEEPITLGVAQYGGPDDDSTVSVRIGYNVSLLMSPLQFTDLITTLNHARDNLKPGRDLTYGIVPAREAVLVDE